MQEKKTIPIINILAVIYMTTFQISNPTQYLTTTLLTINKQQIRSLLRQKS